MGVSVTQPGFIDHIGIGVPDLAAAKQYYDELTAVLGLRAWFETGPEGPLNYGPDGALGSQLFFYRAEPGTYSRSQPGLHHLAFLVATRQVVRDAHEWARTQDAVILDEGRAGCQSPGPKERVGHRPADDQAVRPGKQGLDHVDLPRDLRAAEHGDEGPVGIVESTAQILELPLHQEPCDRGSASGADLLGHTRGGGVSPMGGAEGVVDIQLAELGELGCERRIVFLLARIEAGILQK